MFRSLRIYIMRILPSLSLAIVILFFSLVAIVRVHCCAQITFGLKSDSNGCTVQTVDKTQGRGCI